MSTEIQDKLDLLFDLQNRLMKNYELCDILPEFPVDLSSKDGVKVIKDCLFHISSELHEVAKELKNRPDHLVENPEYDDEALDKELMDVLHLVIELLILCGKTPDEVIVKFKTVNDDNHRRLARDLKQKLKDEERKYDLLG